MKLSCAFKKFERNRKTNTRTQRTKHTNLHCPQTHSILEQAVPLSISSTVGLWNSGPNSFFRYNSLKYSQVDWYFSQNSYVLTARWFKSKTFYVQCLKNMPTSNNYNHKIHIYWVFMSRLLLLLFTNMKAVCFKKAD